MSLRPKGAEDSLGTGPGFLSAKPLRPSLPSGPATLAIPQVKPVSEEPEDDIRSRDPPRDDSQDDEAELSEEQESQEDSEENIPRGIPNFGPGPISRSSNLGSAPGSVQYRPLQQLPPPTARGVPLTTPPPPIQYRPAAKPSKPRKPIEEPFRQQVKPSTKPLKPSQSYDSRGKKPVAQVG